MYKQILEVLLLKVVVYIVCFPGKSFKCKFGINEPRVPITIGIIVDLMLHSFSSTNHNCWYLMISSRNYVISAKIKQNLDTISLHLVINYYQFTKTGRQSLYKVSTHKYIIIQNQKQMHNTNKHKHLAYIYTQVIIKAMPE